jgi:hypothetical protein
MHNQTGEAGYSTEEYQQTHAAIEYLTTETHHPALQVLGQFIRAEEMGSIDRTSIIKATAIHLSNMGWEEDAFPEFFYELGQVAGEEMAKVQKAINHLPPPVASFLHGYSRRINDKMEAASADAIGHPSVQQMVALLEQIAGKGAYAEQPLTEAEKARVVRDYFIRRVGREPDWPDKQHRIYREAQRFANFTTMPKKAGYKHAPESTRYMYTRIIKDLYDEISMRIRSDYSPLQSNIEVLHDTYYAFTITDSKREYPCSFLGQIEMMAYKVITIDPAFYNIAQAQLHLLRLAESHLAAEFFQDPEEYQSSILDIKSALQDPMAYVYEEESPIDTNAPITWETIGKMVHWLQRSSGYRWIDHNPTRANTEPAGGIYDTAKGGLELLKILGNATHGPMQHNTIFRPRRAGAGEIVSVLEYLRDMVDVTAIMSGNPLHVMRFPDALSVFPEELRYTHKFTDYQPLVADTPLSSRVTIASRKKFVCPQYEPDAVYLALPPYTPVSTLALSYTPRGQATLMKLIEGQDFRLQYEPKTGHYRAQLLSERALKAGREGINYVAGLDFIDKQKNVPEQVTVIELHPERVASLSAILREAGFARLADNLQQSLTGHQYDSKTLASAIRASVYYSFKSHPSREVRQASQRVHKALQHDDFDLSFLATLNHEGENGKIGIQCAQVACLYAELINYLSPGSPDKAYANSLIPDVMEGITSIVGVRIYSIGHADTRVILDSQRTRPRRFQQDLTPQIPTPGTIIDAGKSLAYDARLLFKRLDELKVLADRQETIQQILRLKREAGIAMRLHNQELEAFVQTNESPAVASDELPRLAQIQPLGALANILLYTQQTSSVPSVDPQVSKHLLTALDLIIETFDHAAQHGLTNASSRDKPYIQELTHAARIAKQLRRIIS